jgi:hypothetical protein
MDSLARGYLMAEEIVSIRPKQGKAETCGAKELATTANRMAIGNMEGSGSSGFTRGRAKSTVYNQYCRERFLGWRMRRFYSHNGNLPYAVFVFIKKSRREQTELDRGCWTRRFTFFVEDS